VWWRLDRALDLPTLRAAARLYVAEAALHGTVALVDHHESPSSIEGSLDVIADACQEFGMAAVLCYGATERNGGRPEAARGLAECRRFIESNRRPLVRGAVGLHASFTVSDDTIADAGALCRELGAVLHVHVAEDRCDVEDAQRRGFDGPLERLDALGALPRGSILAHGVWLDAAEVRHADANGWWLVQNPRSNRHNKVGYPMALGESAHVALGTDGFISDMNQEMAALRVDAQAHGEPMDVAPGRARGSRELAAALLGGGLITGDRLDVEAVHRQIKTIRAEAARAAAALWTRMAAL
jgi:cytosine/adenosine deaminase-related metal-dependent hydrolase